MMMRWGSIKRRWRILIVLVAMLGLLMAYPAFVLGYTWYHVLGSDLPGGHNGPLDAYRHTLASAVVAYTLNEKAVEWVSRTMETEDWATHRMDRHNNRIGARIGLRARSFFEIEPAVARRVAEGAVFARSENQTTWMPEGCWGDKKLW